MYMKAVVSLVIPIQTGAGVIFLSMSSPSPTVSLYTCIIHMVPYSQRSCTHRVEK